MTQPLIPKLLSTKHEGHVYVLSIQYGIFKLGIIIVLLNTDLQHRCSLYLDKGEWKPFLDDFTSVSRELDAVDARTDLVNTWVPQALQNPKVLTRLKERLNLYHRTQ